MPKASAQLKFLHMAPRKVRVVADLLRGRSVNEAEAELMLHPRRAAKPLLKLLRSAMANAKQQKMEHANLIISEIRVDQGPMLKRFLPRARGMATPIQKKMSNITLILGEGAKKAPRFTIVTERKPKAAPHVHRPKKEKEKPGTPAEEGGKNPRQEKGFWKKMFRRKSV
ncbi:MAG: 50S ribosomal protein L22 [Candidatus Liptonbacteria bacterium]|nr:50S ribosomal protein L22 [Candidatus Liptonbacteria bacterium]